MSAAERLDRVRAEICRAAASVGRDPAEVTLVAISKGRSLPELRVLYDAGVRDFGESRLQEAEPKIAALPGDCRWHFIGSAQTNKLRRIGERFELIHSVAKAEHLRILGLSTSTKDVLLQVNVAGDEQKSGVSLESLAQLLEDALQYERVRVLGLMTIGAAEATDAERRSEFRLLRDAAVRHALPVLSMGMSADFAAAIQEGATLVRVGTALFEAAPPPRLRAIG